MSDRNFIARYNNNLLSGMVSSLIKFGFASWLLMALLIPALFIRHEHEVTSLVLLGLSLTGAIAVIILAIVIRIAERKRVPLC